MQSIDWLCSAAAVRERCAALFAAASDDATPHFKLNIERLDACVDRVIRVTRENYPDLAIPYHSRWRHFSVDGVDHWRELRRSNPHLTGAELARTGIDLVLVSVLLDAGAGAPWRYHSPRTGTAVGRSEGLALASFDMFEAGVFSADPGVPLRADAQALQHIDEAALAAGFQATTQNPLPGLAGRVEILRRLGHALQSDPPDCGADAPRAGHLFDALQAQAEGNRLPAGTILQELLRRFVSIWPNAQRCENTLIGDVGRHPRAGGDGETRGLVPFHKLSQWLAYSLVEPLEWAGIEVSELDALTGLAEYRNGGLFIDTGVLTARDPRLLEDTLEVYAEAVVEWRALTVALLDEVARRMREHLQLTARQLPLAKVLQGGTWATGRRLAQERRRDGGPPIRLASDGTVF